MNERLRANKALAVSLLLGGVGYLAAVTVMSRFTVRAWLALPGLLVLSIAFAAKYVLYAVSTRLTVIHGNTIERSTPFSRRRLTVQRLDFVRYRVRYGSGLAGKKYFFAISPARGCEFYLTASMWSESDLARIAARLNGTVRGTWTDAVDVARVGPTFGGPCHAW